MGLPMVEERRPVTDRISSKSIEYISDTIELALR